MRREPSGSVAGCVAPATSGPALRAGVASGRPSRGVPPRPLRGGDSNTPPPAPPSNPLNRTVRLAGQGVPGLATEPTSDPADWAHGVLDPATMLTVPAAQLPVLFHGRKPGRPREYPSHQMVGPPHARVGVDSAYDASAARAARLQAEGVELGWHPMPHETVRALLASRGPSALRDTLRPPRERHDGETPRERSLRKAADFFLETHKANASNGLRS